MKAPWRTLLLAALLLPFTASAGDGLRLVERNGTLSRYEGQITVSGRYERHTQDEFLPNLLCFYAEGPTARRVPRDADDPRMPWFCFENQREAQALLKVDRPTAAGSCGHTGQATVTVSHYLVNQAASEVYDTARLVQLHDATPPRPLPCLDEGDAP